MGGSDVEAEHPGGGLGAPAIAPGGGAIVAQAGGDVLAGGAQGGGVVPAPSDQAGDSTEGGGGARVEAGPGAVGTTGRPFDEVAEATGLEPIERRIPDAILDFRYATPNNFLGRAVYPPEARCLLRPKTAAKLARVADRLRGEDGTRLLLFDCYRPLSVQRLMWEVFPVRGYVAPPSSGSIHNRGAAVDLSLADASGAPLEMPTDFDEFTERAWPSYQGGTRAQRRNRDRLRAAMRAEGFVGIRKEWWHYEDPEERQAPLLDHPFAGAD